MVRRPASAVSTWSGVVNMPGRQRRDNDKALVREKVIASAMHLLETEGAAGVTMRRVADAMDYTAPVIYQHSENKDALLGELVRQGYGELLITVAHRPERGGHRYACGCGRGSLSALRR